MTSDQQHGQKAPRKALGLVFILLVVLIWVAAAFVIQAAQGAGVHVIVLTFIANALFTLYLPVHYVNVRLKRLKLPESSGLEQTALVPKGATLEEGPPPPAQQQDGPSPAIPWGILKAALIIGPLWFFAQLVFNLSLAHTSVTSSLLLSSTSSLFTFFFSVGLLSEKFTLRKLGCILLLVLGTAVYTYGDAEQSSGDTAQETLLGDLLVLASAVLYALYTITIRLMLGDEDESPEEGPPMTLFFGLSGLTVLLGLGPPLLILWLGGMDLGSMTWGSFGLVVAMGLIDNVLSDFLYARAILLIGPTIASAGLSLQVPLAVVSDAIFHSPAWIHKAGTAALTLSGAALILAGFLGINLSGSSNSRIGSSSSRGSSSNSCGRSDDSEHLRSCSLSSSPLNHSPPELSK